MTRGMGWVLAALLAATACGSGDDGGGTSSGGSGASGGSGGASGSGSTSGGGGSGATTSGGSAGISGSAGNGGSTGGSSGAGGSGATTSGGGSGGTGGAGGTPGVSGGIWTSAAELANKPMTGAAWTTLLSDADADTSNPNASDQDDATNVRVLAAAIVYARNGDAKYKSKVVAACQKVVGTEKGGRSLAWGRETGAYAMAADLVGYRTPAFEAWLHNVADVEKCSELGITLREMFKKRPNNWGAMAFGSLTAIDRYLDDKAALKAVRDYWVLGVTGPNPGLKYDVDVSWHVNASDLRLINPKGATKQGIDIDGVIPDDMRRGASFTTGAPVFTGYPWEHLQGVLMAARVLERAGMPIWTVDDSAISRAATQLQLELGGAWVATGDDRWQLAFLDQAYGTKWAGSANVWGAGKNTGFAYVLP